MLKVPTSRCSFVWSHIVVSSIRLFSDIPDAISRFKKSSKAIRQIVQPPSTYKGLNMITFPNKSERDISLSICVFPDGSIYEGQMKGKVKHGRGTLTLRTGVRITSIWEHDIDINAPQINELNNECTTSAVSREENFQIPKTVLPK